MPEVTRNDTPKSAAERLYEKYKELIKEYWKMYSEKYLSQGGEIVNFENFSDNVVITLEQAKEFITFMGEQPIIPALRLEANPNTDKFLYKDQKQFNLEFFAKHTDGIIKRSVSGQIAA